MTIFGSLLWLSCFAGIDNDGMAGSVICRTMVASSGCVLRRQTLPGPTIPRPGIAQCRCTYLPVGAAVATAAHQYNLLRVLMIYHISPGTGRRIGSYLRSIPRLSIPQPGILKYRMSRRSTKEHNFSTICVIG